MWLTLVAAVVAAATALAFTSNIAQAATLAKGKPSVWVNDFTPRCLDADKFNWFAAPSQSVVVAPQPCNGGPNQIWFAFGNAQSETGSRLRIIGPPRGPSNRCLDAWRDKRQFGGYAVALFSCDKRRTQRWQWISMGRSNDAGYMIRNVRWNRCLMLFGTQGGNALHVGLTACDGKSRVVWRLDR